MRKFNMASLLNVVTRILFSEMGDVYEILDYMTGDSLYIHQLPRACDCCKPYLVEQHPFLLEVILLAEKATGEETKDW